MEFGCFKNPCKIEMKKNIYKYNFNKKIKNNIFSIQQLHVKSQPSFYNQFVNEFVVFEMTYKGEYIEAKNYNSDLPLLLLSIKDNSELLKTTLNNLRTYGIDALSNILVIDDRPSNELNKKTANNFECSYLKVVNNENIFNFSMLHNLAVHIVQQKHKNLKTIILWNSDLWAKDSQTVPELLKLHKENQSTISGTKLVYPDQTFDYCQPSKANTVQFGGSMFGPRTDMVGLFPFHLYRGYSPEDEKVNCNKGELFITGAFMIVDAKWFIKSGGFCPVFTVALQDADLCLRAILQSKKVFYFGKNLELYHYESYLRGWRDENIKQPDRIDNDVRVYTKLWDEKRVRNLLFKLE